MNLPKLDQSSSQWTATAVKITCTIPSTAQNSIEWRFIERFVTLRPMRDGMATVWFWHQPTGHGLYKLANTHEKLAWEFVGPVPLELKFANCEQGKV